MQLVQNELAIVDENSDRIRDVSFFLHTDHCLYRCDVGQKVFVNFYDAVEQAIERVRDDTDAREAKNRETETNDRLRRYKSLEEKLLVDPQFAGKRGRPSRYSYVATIYEADIPYRRRTTRVNGMEVDGELMQVVERVGILVDARKRQS